MWDGAKWVLCKKSFLAFNCKIYALAPDPYLESESEYSASCSEEEDEEDQKEVSIVLSSQKTPGKTKAASTPPPRNSLAKKIKEEKMVSVQKYTPELANMKGCIVTISC